MILQKELETKGSALEELIGGAKGKIIADLIHGQVGLGLGLQKAALRNDWLYLEELSSSILCGLSQIPPAKPGA